MAVTINRYPSGMPDLLIKQFRVRINGSVQGPFPVHALRRVPGFTLQTPIQPLGADQWTPAFQILDLKAYFNNPVKNSFVAQSNISKTADLLLSRPPGVRRARQRFSTLTKATILSTVLAASAAAAAWKIVGPQDAATQTLTYINRAQAYLTSPAFHTQLHHVLQQIRSLAKIIK